MTTSKKITIIANSTWNIYNFRQDLIQHLKSRGFRITVIAPIDEYIHYLNKSYFTKHIPLNHLKAQGTSMFEDFSLLLELYKILRKEKPDLILSYTIKPNIYASIVARVLHIPCISTVTGLGTSYQVESGLDWKIKLLYNIAFKKNKFVVFHNAEDKEIMECAGLVTLSQSKVISGSGVDTQKFASIHNTNERRFTFLFLGRLLKDKGLLEFVSAAKYARDVLKNVQFCVAGQLNENNPNSITKKQLLDWVEHRDIKYVGEEKDVRKVISHCTVFVLPSYREGLPKAILEAMAMAKPIITTNVAGCRDTVKQNENGYLVEAKDDMELAEAMIKMYQLSADELREMGKKSREKVIQHFSKEKILSQYDDIINEVFLMNMVDRKLKLNLNASQNIPAE